MVAQEWLLAEVQVKEAQVVAEVLEERDKIHLTQQLLVMGAME